MSGRGMGDCTDQGSVVAGPRGRGFGRGWGRGWGRGLGRGWGRGFGRGRGGGLEAVPVDDEIEGLRTESSRLKALLEGIDRRLSSFEKRD
jgi:hypothetical protein